jgi:hypothetical protein
MLSLLPCRSAAAGIWRQLGLRSLLRLESLQRDYLLAQSVPLLVASLSQSVRCTVAAAPGRMLLPRPVIGCERHHAQPPCSRIPSAYRSSD